jgi:hypothetical protein
MPRLPSAVRFFRALFTAEGTEVFAEEEPRKAEIRSLLVFAVTQALI